MLALRPIVSPAGELMGAVPIIALVVALFVAYLVARSRRKRS